MRRNRMMALLLAGCMVLGHSNVLLYAEETDEQFYMIEEDEEPEIQEDIPEEEPEIPEEDLVEEEEDLYATDLIEVEEEELYAAEIGDSEAPVFDASTIKLELPDGQSTVTGGDTVKLSVRVTDASGIDLAMVTYKMPTAGEKEYYLRYNDETQKYETSITISKTIRSSNRILSELRRLLLLREILGAKYQASIKSRQSNTIEQISHEFARLWNRATICIYFGWIRGGDNHLGEQR